MEIVEIYNIDWRKKQFRSNSMRSRYKVLYYINIHYFYLNFLNELKTIIVFMGVETCSKYNGKEILL